MTPRFRHVGLITSYSIFPIGFGSISSNRRDRRQPTMDPHVDTIHDAAWCGDLDSVRAFVHAGIPPSAPYAAFLGSSETPMLLAAENERLGVIDFLIKECGVDVDRERDDEGGGALHYACMGRSTPAVAHLLHRHRADPMVYHGKTGQTPLMVAAAHGPTATVRVVLDDGRCDVEAPRRGRRGGQTALLEAAKGQQWASVEGLLEHGADPTVVWPGRAEFLKRMLLEFARTDPKCPPELLARIESTVAEAERTELLHRLRFQCDAGAAAAARTSAAADGAPQRETRGAVARRVLKRVPPCLAGRVRQRRPLPRMEFADEGGGQDGGRGSSGKRAKMEPGRCQDEEDAAELAKSHDDVRARLVAVAAHVAMGGMVREHVLELLAAPQGGASAAGFGGSDGGWEEESVDEERGVRSKGRLERCA